MATAAYLAKLYVTGTSTGLTGGAGEPMSDVSGGARTTYQVTDTAKQVIDPATAIVVFDNNTGAPYANSFTIDYLTGSVTLSVAAGALGVKLQGNYLPKRQILNAYEMSVSLSKNLVDTSVLGTDHMLRTPALGDVTGSFTCYENGTTTYTDIQLVDLANDGTIKVIDMDMSGTGANFIRFFAIFESLESSQSVDGVQTATVNASMASQTALTTSQEVDYSIV
jgi:hypothetical protein